MPTFFVRNLRVLREVRWETGDLQVLVGPNGSGKSTFLLALKFLRAATDRNVADACDSVLGGSHGLRNRNATEEESVEFGVDMDDLRWRLRLSVQGASLNPNAHESLHDGETLVFQRDAGDAGVVHNEQRLHTSGQLGVTWLAAYLAKSDPRIQSMATLLRSITVFHDPDLFGLRAGGSKATAVHHMHARGSNAFAMLKSWRLSLSDEERFEFVRNGLRDAFPKQVLNVDFQEAGQTVSMRFFPPGVDADAGVLAQHEANGVLAGLVLLCQVAGAERGGIVGIDEPENGLHPFAIRRLLEHVRQRAQTHRLTVLLSSHSPVLLNEMAATPEHVLVLRELGRGPERLTDIKTREWLSGFLLGNLLANDDLGSNDEPSAA